ncbi:methylated-DNA--[protein]-cysteine S-methyltransferase [Prevotella sp.]|uniref:methylated-DNA--[protein]-cysteine S-methyltransferase n=1 Tax=Prevotella sp. TaxID=59823 RepID=UPI002F930DA2
MTTHYLSYYTSPLGVITLGADEIGLTGLWFEGQKYYGRGLSANSQIADRLIFRESALWLDQYFNGQKPDFMPQIHLQGTNFQQAVWRQLLRIPYGQTVTYKHIAHELAREMGVEHMSAQAVGNAVGRNPVSIIIPCHRVLGTDGSLRGYAGGLHRKQWLLHQEGIVIK